VPSACTLRIASSATDGFESDSRGISSDWNCGSVI
jgi:hypothetical protein